MKPQSILNAALRVVPWAARQHIKRMPLMAQLQRLIVAKALDGKEFLYCVSAGPAKGITFDLRMPEDKGIWTGTYEAEFAVRLANAVKPGIVAYDIGGWHGFFAGVMAGRGAEVHVFEPLLANINRIRRLVALNPSRSIVLHEWALGDRDTVMDLVVMPDTSMAKLEESEFQAELKPPERVRVPVRSLDSVLKLSEASPPALIKMDVEGAELMVLEGARETLRRHRPEIFAEIHSSALLVRCRGLLENEGYRVKSLDEDPDEASRRDMFRIHAKDDRRA